MPRAAPEGFPRARRLLVAAQFDYVFADPVKNADAYFVVLARCRVQTGGGPRLGLVISRKCAARAVERNRLKRLVRESFRRRWSQWQTCPVDVVVMGRRAAVTVAAASLTASLTQHWQYVMRRLCAECCSF